MQKGNAKAGKISIFSPLDAKLGSLTGRVELTQFPVGSGRVELKICSTRLESGWKCEQPDFESGRIQNVNPKLDSTISLFTLTDFFDEDIDNVSSKTEYSLSERKTQITNVAK